MPDGAPPERDGWTYLGTTGSGLLYTAPPGTDPDVQALPEGDPAVIAYCGPGRRPYASLVLLLAGEHVDEVIETPHLPDPAAILLADPAVFDLPPVRGTHRRPPVTPTPRRLDHAILGRGIKSALTCDVSAKSGPRHLLERHPMPDSATPVPPGVYAVPLGGKRACGRVLWVDGEDYDKTMECRWSVHERRRPDGTITSGPYAGARVPGAGRCGRGVLLHNWITGQKGIDHRNGDGLDCRRCNLREATPIQNGANQGPRGGTSRYKGVSWHKARNLWRARLRHGRVYDLGHFASEITAARAVDEVAQELQGEFAWLNRDHFPEVRDD